MLQQFDEFPAAVESVFEAGFLLQPVPGLNAELELLEQIGLLLDDLCQDVGVSPDQGVLLFTQQRDQ